MEPECADFFREAVQLRRRLARYFCAGEMARPPRLQGDIPTVRADWQWYGTTWVTTEAVLTSAWHLPKERRLVLMFANVSDQPVTARLEYDAAPYVGDGESLSVTRIGPRGSTEPEPATPQVNCAVTFPARAVTAWEVRY
jgi:hypothetical protein